MGDKRFKNSSTVRTDIAALEADVAFFAARLSLAGKQTNSAYQQAQKKAYQALGEQMTDTLIELRSRSRR